MIENKRRTLLLSLVFISFALVLSFLLIFAKILIYQPLSEQLLLERAQETFVERENYLQTYINMAEQNLLSIRKSSFFNNYLASKSNYTGLENYLLAYASSRSDFMKIRYINAEGDEELRIERTNYGDIPVVVSKEKLQDKSDRSFFTDSIVKTPEAVWFSPIDLNVENNQIEQPYKPTIRAILPLSKDGSFNGILIINYFMEKFLFSFSSTPQFSLALFDDDGNTIYYDLHPSQSDEKSWGNSLPDGYNILSELKNNPFVYQTQLPIDKGLHLALHVKDAYLQQEAKNHRQEYIMIFIVILFSSLVLTFFITRFLSRTLLNFDQVQQLYDSLLNASTVAKIGFWELNPQTNELKCSDGFNHIFEFTRHPDTMTLSDFLSYIPLEDQEQVRQELSSSILEHRELNLIHRLSSPNGTYRYVEERGKHYFNRNGKHIKSVGSLYDITEKYLSDQKFKLLLDQASDGIFLMNPNGRLLNYSKKSLELLGYSEEEMQQLSVFDWDPSMSPDNWQEMLGLLSQHPLEIERIHHRKDNTTYIAHITAQYVSIENQSYIYSSVRDVSKQKELQKTLDDNRLRWQFAVEGNKDGLWDWNLDTNEVYFSPQWKAMIGFEDHEITGSLEEWKERVSPEDFDKVIADLKNYLDGHVTHYSNEHRILCKDGSYKWIRDRGIIIERNPDGSPHRMIGTHTDISEYINALELIKKQTYIDDLTQLHNRKAYKERLTELLEQYRRYQLPFSLIMLDIDLFKRINDTYGHSIGDVVLQKLASLLTNISRKNDYLYRIGGEEFVFLLTGTELANALVFAEKARLTVQNELILSELNDLKVTISLGVAQAADADTIDSIFHRADQALYQAKEKGRNQVRF